MFRLVKLFRLFLCTLGILIINILQQVCNEEALCSQTGRSFNIEGLNSEAREVRLKFRRRYNMLYSRLSLSRSQRSRRNKEPVRVTMAAGHWLCPTSTSRPKSECKEAKRDGGSPEPPLTSHPETYALPAWGRLGAFRDFLITLPVGGPGGLLAHSRSIRRWIDTSIPPSIY